VRLSSFVGRENEACGSCPFAGLLQVLRFLDIRQEIVDALGDGS
jgi:hypothetical protein